MSKKIKLPEVKQLITLGKEKGFLTFDEINDALPEEAATSDFLDEIITLLSQLKIDVIDNKSKKGNIFPTNVVIDDEDDEDDEDGLSSFDGEYQEDGEKVLLLGSESTGKSTLTINLANYYNTNYIEEAGRELSEKSGTDLLMLSEDFTEILLTHKLNEIKAIESSNKILFVDTDAIITNFYMHFLEDENIIDNERLAKAIIHINKYDAILFLEPDVDFVQDGDRSEIIKNDRIKYSNKIKDILNDLNIKYYSINGNYQERFKKAVSIIDELLENKQ